MAQILIACSPLSLVGTTANLLPFPFCYLIALFTAAMSFTYVKDSTEASWHPMEDPPGGWQHALSEEGFPLLSVQVVLFGKSTMVVNAGVPRVLDQVKGWCPR